MNMLALLVLACVMLINVDLAACKCGFSDKIRRQDFAWCLDDGSNLHVGRINSDNLADLLCHDNVGNEWIAYGRKDEIFKNDVFSAMEWCHHTDAKVYTGDFNGDGRTDMLCRDSGYNMWIAFANSQRQYLRSSWYQRMAWCYHRGSELLIGDFNGDGRSDLLCHDQNNGDKFISFADPNGHFNTTIWYGNVKYCYGNGKKLLIGDVNGDGRDDMVCHNRATLFASRTKWCKGDHHYLADVNGDGRKDLVCHWKSVGWMQVFLYTAGRNNVVTDWENRVEFCSSSDAKIFVGDFNGDKKEDLLCHNREEGIYLIRYAECR